MSHNALFNAAIVTNFRDSRNSLIRDGVQFCSGLVDLVVCVGDDGCLGHRLTLTGERFVGLMAEHIAKVSDRSADLRDRRRGGGIERESCNGRRCFMASEPVEKSGEDRQRARRRAVLRESW